LLLQIYGNFSQHLGWIFEPILNVIDVSSYQSEQTIEESHILPPDRLTAYIFPNHLICSVASQMLKHQIRHNG
jgi:hypothetical protein